MYIYYLVICISENFLLKNNICRKQITNAQLSELSQSKHTHELIAHLKKIYYWFNPLVSFPNHYQSFFSKFNHFRL